MTMFTTRVELHSATWQDYEDLHSAMKKKGFTTTIKADGGQIYQLPPAEYNYIGSEDANAVLERAKAAAGSVKKSYAVIVSESNLRTWFGLPKA
jgi:hypothetical protein